MLLNSFQCLSQLLKYEGKNSLPIIISAEVLKIWTLKSIAVARFLPFNSLGCFRWVYACSLSRDSLKYWKGFVPCAKTAQCSQSIGITVDVSCAKAVKCNASIRSKVYVPCAKASALSQTEYAVCTCQLHLHYWWAWFCTRHGFHWMWTSALFTNYFIAPCSLFISHCSH